MIYCSRHGDPKQSSDINGYYAFESSCRLLTAGTIFDEIVSQMLPHQGIFMLLFVCRIVAMLSNGPHPILMELGGVENGRFSSYQVSLSFLSVPGICSDLLSPSNSKTLIEVVTGRTNRTASAFTYDIE
jgi:hypothetical protein